MSTYKKEYAEIAYGMCLLGATNKIMAEEFGVAESTIVGWRAQHEEFDDALKRGKMRADIEVVKSLFNRAKGMIVTDKREEESIDESEDGYKRSKNTQTFTRELPPDPTSMIFWLKNRQPAKWRDKQETENEHSLNVNYNVLPPRESE